MNITKNRIALESLAELMPQNSIALTINRNKQISRNNLNFSGEYSGQTRPVIPDESRPLSNER